MSTKHLVAYGDEGRIVLVASGPKESVEQTIRLNTDLPFLEVSEPCDPARCYVQNHQVVPRPSGKAVVSKMTLSGVPDGASISIEGENYTADGSDIELEFSRPGSYTITISKWPYQDQEVTVENTA